MVVENVEHHIEHEAAAREATIKAMNEVTGPVIAITLVLMAVFVPCAFIGGITGQFFRQFALTIAASTIISAINALTLRPARAPPGCGRRTGGRTLFFRGVRRRLRPARARSTPGLVRQLRPRRCVVMLALRRRCVGLTGWWYHALPTGFLPDRGPGLPHRRRAAARRRVAGAHARPWSSRSNEILARRRASRTGSCIGGFSLLDGTTARTRRRCSSPGRTGTKRNDAEPAARTRSWASSGQRSARSRRRSCSSFAAAGDPRARRAGGFQMQVEDREGVGLRELQAADRRRSWTTATRRPGWRRQRHLPAGVPQLYADIDRVKAKSAGRAAERRVRHAAGLPRLGLRQRLQQVRPHVPGPRAGRPVPRRPEDIRRLEVRNRTGRDGAAGHARHVEKSLGPQIIYRYNLYPSARSPARRRPGQLRARPST